MSSAASAGALRGIFFFRDNRVEVAAQHTSQSGCVPTDGVRRAPPASQTRRPHRRSPRLDLNDRVHQRRRRLGGAP
jgi:hypothetical protein